MIFIFSFFIQIEGTKLNFPFKQRPIIQGIPLF